MTRTYADLTVVPANEATCADLESILGRRGGGRGPVGHLDGEPAGCCAVEPRPAYGGLLQVYRGPWEPPAFARSAARVFVASSCGSISE